MLDWLRRLARPSTSIVAGRAVSTEPSGPADFFDAEFQRRLENLALASRRIAEGTLHAERRSRRSGSGVEFADHRPYTTGDDFRFLDWKLYGRSDRLFVRMFEEQEDLSVYVALDCSASMHQGAPPKLQHAKRVAAALAYVALANLDRLSVIAFRDDVVARLQPQRGKGRILTVLDFLRPLIAQGPTDFARSMKSFAAQHKRRGLVLVLSDAFDQKGFETGIDVLRFAKFEPIVLQLVDTQDAGPVATGDVRLRDAETGASRDLTLTPAALRRSADAHAALVRRIAVHCASKRVVHVAAHTSEPWDSTVLGLLRRTGVVG